MSNEVYYYQDDTYEEVDQEHVDPLEQRPTKRR